MPILRIVQCSRHLTGHYKRCHLAKYFTKLMLYRERCKGHVYRDSHKWACSCPGASARATVTKLKSKISVGPAFEGKISSVYVGGNISWGTSTKVYIYIYYPLYTNWPITNADLPHEIIQYILYFICQKLYWTASGQRSNIGYIGQFQNEATGTLRTRNRRTKAVSMHLMKILSIFLHLRKILICFRIGWFL